MRNMIMGTVVGAALVASMSIANATLLKCDGRIVDVDEDKAGQMVGQGCEEISGFDAYRNSQSKSEWIDSTGLKYVIAGLALAAMLVTIPYMRRQ